MCRRWCDIVFLYKNGFEVYGNEYDKSFLEVAKKNLESHGVKIEIKTCKWEELDTCFPSSSFDALLCVGNSISCLLSLERVKLSLEKFYKLLKSQGILIIDERNYECSENGEKVMYYGKGYLTSFEKTGEPSLLNFTVENINRNENYSGKVYHFKPGELLKLLRDAGFERIKTYSDLKYGYDLEASFYHYICLKKE